MTRDPRITTSAALRELDEKIGELNAQLEKVESRAQALRGQIEVCQQAKSLITPKLVRGKGNCVQKSRVRADELRGMTLHDACVLYAERHDGLLNSYKARPLFIDAGILTGENTSTELHSELSQSVEFEERGDKRGRWKYIPVGDSRRQENVVELPSLFGPPIRRKRRQHG